MSCTCGAYMEPSGCPAGVLPLCNTFVKTIFYLYGQQSGSIQNRRDGMLGLLNSNWSIFTSWQFHLLKIPILAPLFKTAGVSCCQCCEDVPLDTSPVPVQVLTSYFPSYGSGSLQYFKKNLKIKFLSIIFPLKLDGNRLILT